MGFLKEHGSEIARTTVISILGAIGIVLTPVRDRVTDWFRPEAVNISIQSPDSVVIGHALDVSVVIAPRTTTTISGGTLDLSISPQGSLVQLTDASNNLPVPDFTNVTTQPSTPVRF